MSGRVLGVVLSLLLALGCDLGVSQPKEPVWGKQPCEHCAMLLSDKQHGAQLVTVQTDRLYFDDLGCMVAWTLDHPGEAVGQWVRTVDTEAWLSVNEAGFERSDRTPMGFGFVAQSKPGSTSWSEVGATVQRKLQSE